MSLSELETAPLSRLFWRYVTPTVASMLATGLYILVDGMFVGHVLGTDGLAGITLSYPIAAVVYAVGALIGMGASAQASFHLGEGKTDKARRIVGNALWMVILSALVLGAAGLLFGDSLLWWIGAREEIFEAGSAYLVWYSALGVFPLVSMVFSALLRNDGRPGLATVIQIAGAFLNVFLDWFFLVVLPWGLAGVALATMLSQATTGLWAFSRFFSRRSHLRIGRDSLRPSLETIGKISLLGIASFLMYLYLSVVLTLHNKAFLWAGEAVHVAAYGIVGYVESLAYLIFEGVAFGIQPIASFNSGAGRWDRVFKIRNLALAVVTMLGLLFWLGTALWPQTVVLLFTGPGYDPSLMSVTVEGIRLYFWGMPLEGILLTGAVYLQAVCRARAATFFNGSKLILVALLLFGLGGWLGVAGVWLSLPLCNAILVMIMAAVLWREKPVQPC